MADLKSLTWANQKASPEAGPKDPKHLSAVGDRRGFFRRTLSMDGRRIQEKGFGPTTSAALPPPPPLASLQDDPDHRCTGRVRMRRWLMTQVMSGRYSGLKWIDREKTLLRIPWKHGSRSGWSAEDGKLFESWAIQSGQSLLPSFLPSANPSLAHVWSSLV